MQLDKTLIVIRERDLLDILDLSLHAVRALGGSLFLAAAAGIVPIALLNHWCIGDAGEFQDELWWQFEFTFKAAFMIVLLAPLATAPMTLYLGQAVFLQRPSPLRIARGFFGSLPQLILFQFLLRGILLVPMVTCFLPFSVWPYLSEIILLERNPMRSRGGKQISTMRRSSALHGANIGNLFGRWLATALAMTAVFVSLVAAVWGLKQWTSGSTSISRLTFMIYIEGAMWLTVGLFAVVRFLCYLDLRIRREGWEVELRMRAEAARLARQLA